MIEENNEAISLQQEYSHGVELINELAGVDQSISSTNHMFQQSDELVITINSSFPLSGVIYNTQSELLHTNLQLETANAFLPNSTTEMVSPDVENLDVVCKFSCMCNVHKFKTTKSSLGYATTTPRPSSTSSQHFHE